jgi:hypothetical protein
MKIERFEIDSWGCVKLRTYNNGRSIEYEYNNVPKKIILKLLQSKATPDLTDFDGWFRDHRAKKNKGTEEVCSYDWWNRDSDDA